MLFKKRSDSILLLLSALFLIFPTCFEGETVIEVYSESTPAPDWTLQDMNPYSNTYGMMLTLSELKGSVIGLYFAKPICGLCIEQVIALEGLYQDNLEDWSGNVLFIIINPIEYRDYMDNLFPYTTSPIVQDSEEEGVSIKYDAEYYNLFLITEDGYLFKRYPHPPERMEELKEEIESLQL